MKKTQNLIKNIYLGLEKALTLRKLPLSVYKIHNHLIYRILRVIGGICFLLMISKISNQFPFEISIIINILGVIHTIQMTIIIIIKTIYVFYIIIYKPELLEVRDSPLK